MGLNFSKENYFMKINNCGKTISPGKYATFDTIGNCITYIHREFKLPNKYTDYHIEGYRISDKFHYPEKITLINSCDDDGTENRFTFSFSYNRDYNKD
jgi:hypothetical protein